MALKSATMEAEETAGSLRESIAALAQASGEAYRVVLAGLEEKLSQLEAQALRYSMAIENVSEGVCFFSAERRMVLSNRRYAEIYKLTPDETLPGTPYRQIIDRRVALGTSPMSTDEYLALCERINAGSNETTWVASLADGRQIRIRHQPMPDGGWISTHEDITLAAEASEKDRISLQALIDRVPDNLWMKDVESRFVIANDATARRMGYAVRDIIGKNDFDLCPPETAKQYFADEQRVIQTGQAMVDKEEYVVGGQGEKTWILTTKVPLRNEKGETFGLVGCSRDITDRRQADLLRDGQARILEEIATAVPLETILDHLVHLIEAQLTGLTGAIVLIENDGTQMRHGSAPSMAPVFVRTVERVATDSLAAVLAGGRPFSAADIRSDPVWQPHRKFAEAEGYRSCWAVAILSHDRQPLGVILLFARPLRQPTSAEENLLNIFVGLAGIAIDRTLAQARIQFMASHDALTGLPNRLLLRDRIAQSVLYSQRYDKWTSVAFVDLDNFKAINDTLGHNAGDELLKAVARRMVACLREIDTVVRLGGDEFVILLSEQPKDPEAIAATINKIRAAIAEPLQIEGQTLRVTSSVGVATYPHDGADADTLLANADAAMYRAKELGRDNFQFYTFEMNEKAREDFALQEDLRNALARREFVVFYQPQVEMRGERVFAVEALLRWNHPTRGLTPPDAFIPMAEQMGLIVPIGAWVLREACRQNKAWQDAGLPPMSVTVNVSARQFRDRQFVGHVLAALKESGLEARYLELELTESLVMQDTEQAVATMGELQRLGVQLAIDDFGTGYSSLSALKTFPVARLKIDRSFIKELPTSANDRAVTTAMISLGKKLNLKVIAEGVETDEQIAFLRANHCDELQGFHFSRPIPPGELEAFIRARKPSTRGG